MGSLQTTGKNSLASKFDFSKYSSLVDAGGAGGDLCIEVAKKYPHMKCITFDLP